MATFILTLQPTYYKQGFFNVVVDYDRYVRTNEGPVRLRLGRAGIEIQGKINRRVNPNGTARILGGVKLRDWFQANFEPMDAVSVSFDSPELIVLEKPNIRARSVQNRRRGMERRHETPKILSEI